MCMQMSRNGSSWQRTILPSKVNSTDPSCASSSAFNSAHIFLSASQVPWIFRIVHQFGKEGSVGRLIAGMRDLNNSISTLHSPAVTQMLWRLVVGRLIAGTWEVNNSPTLSQVLRVFRIVHDFGKNRFLGCFFRGIDDHGTLVIYGND